MNTRNVVGAAVLTGAVVVTGLLAGPSPTPQTGCVRKVPDAGECLQWRAAPGEEPAAVDPGDWNRFRASQARGEGCEPVECVIPDGERANP